jgi:2-methylcitrate dehydratase PrpD
MGVGCSGNSTGERGQVELTRALARNIVATEYSDLPAAVRDATKRSILDTLGVMFPPTRRESACIALAELIVEAGGKPESTVIGGGKVPCWSAALVNGALAHALDYDDGIEAPPHHPTASTFPAALAMAEKIGGVSGKDFIAAVALGNDLSIRLASGPKGKLVEDYPWFPITTFGVFSAAAAVAKLLRLSEEQTVNALGIALGRVSGIMEAMTAPKSEIRAIRDGFSNKEGVFAALMAWKGIAACDNAIEILYRTLYRDDCNPGIVTSALGVSFRGADVHLKAWPSCRETHGHIQAALEIRRKHGIGAAQISEVVLTVGHFGAERLCEPMAAKRNPTLSIGAKFSLPFTVALALAKGKVEIADFFPENLNHPDILSLAARIGYKVDASFGIVTPAIVELRTTDGRILSERVDRVYGDPGSPLQEADLIAKFKDCIRYARKKVTEERANILIRRLLTLEETADMREIVNLI